MLFRLCAGLDIDVKQYPEQTIAQIDAMVQAIAFTTGYDKEKVFNLLVEDVPLLLRHMLTLDGIEMPLTYDYFHVSCENDIKNVFVSNEVHMMILDKAATFLPAFELGKYYLRGTRLSRLEAIGMKFGTVSHVLKQFARRTKESAPSSAGRLIAHGSDWAILGVVHDENISRYKGNIGSENNDKFFGGLLTSFGARSGLNPKYVTVKILRSPVLGAASWVFLIRWKKLLPVLSMFPRMIGYAYNKKKRIAAEEANMRELWRDKVVARLMAEKEELISELKRLSLTDPLTGLHNREYLKQHIERLWAWSSRQEETTVSVLMIDIDYFKLVNDTYGHAAGDAVLVQLSILLRETLLRRDNILLRWGGEEFCAYLGNAPFEGAMQVAENIRTIVNAHQFILPNGATISCTVSIGVATQQPSDFPEDNGVMLRDHADRELYRAKNSGRNRVLGCMMDKTNVTPESIELIFEPEKK